MAAADCGIGLNGESPQRRRPAPRGGERETAQRARGIASRIPSDPRDPNSLSGNRFATRLEVPSSRCRNCIADAIMVAKGG
ncbi:hypothetical protein I545_3748 [Mycobacterium kansasii 662]|uniref:Uncharacterized protein n=1 Tax=Mycobacterium kansasii 662 TaxID=1299326 RepID=X7ZBG6_MYCKA|nr:hypothetical protein I545_3748 [Mycobacterium kansasii 662]